MRYVVIVHDSHMSQRANDERMQSSTLTAETSMGSTLTRVAIDESQIISTKTRVLKSNSRYSLCYDRNYIVSCYFGKISLQSASSLLN